MTVRVFRDLTPCSLVNTYQHVGEPVAFFAEAERKSPPPPQCMNQYKHARYHIPVDHSLDTAWRPQIFVSFITIRAWVTIAVEFYICSSVHRNYRLKKSNKMQQYAYIYLLLNYCTCVWRPSRPSSGVYKTVVAASGTDHTIWGASFLKRDQIRTGLGLAK